MKKNYHLLTKERIASIRDIQKSPSKSLQGITRVMRGSTTIGFFFGNDELGELLEDIEAASSKTLRAEVKKARKGLEKKETVSLAKLAKEYGL